MLEELHVRDLASVRDAWLEFAPGLNVLTGETGAGKTVLVGALQLLLGARADSHMVRSGAEEAAVSGRFLLGDAELVGRRRLTAEGRSRCYLDDEPATVGTLAERLGPLVDLHGQHEHQALLATATHVRYLDRAAGTGAAEALAAYRAALAAYRGAVAERDELTAALGDRDRRADYLRFQVTEIDALAPRAGEDEELESLLPRLRHGEKLSAAAAAAFAALRGDDGASDATARAMAALAAVAGIDPELDALAEEVGSAAAALDDAGGRLRDRGEAVDYDPRALNEAEARLAALATLKRKYGPSLADVLGTREEAQATLERLDAGERGLAEIEARVAEAEAGLRAAASALSEARASAAPVFSAALAEAAADLALPGAVFDVARTPLPFQQWGSDGPERVEFLFSANAGETARPLARIASGGEVSRVMLALKGVLGGADDVPVLVFDEVDAGIGGATGLAVGARLRALARTHQVLVVTHLAQVAAFADRHLVVEKAEQDGRAETRVRVVDGDERVAEVARMLSGGTTAAGLEHARELLGSVTDDDRRTRVLEETG